MTDAVVVGAGILGASAAYHLALAGVGTTLVDSAPSVIGSQTSSAGAGFVAGSSGLEYDLMRYGQDFYTQLQEDSGRDLGVVRSGFVIPFLSHDVMAKSMSDPAARATPGIEYIGAYETLEIVPILRPGSVVGAMYRSHGCQISADRVMFALGEQLVRLGVRMCLGEAVERVDVAGGAVRAVITDHSVLNTRVVVNAAGAFAHALGARNGVNVGAVPILESRFISQPVRLPDQLPMVLIHERDLLYFRRERDRLLVGAIEREVSPDSFVDLWSPPSVSALSGHAAAKHLSLARSSADVVPMLRDIQAMTVSSGLPTWTPDGGHIVGEAPHLTGYYVLAGCVENGFTRGPALGRIISQLVATGTSASEISAWRVGRFGGLSEAELIEAARRSYLRRHGSDDDPLRSDGRRLRGTSHPDVEESGKVR